MIHLAVVGHIKRLEQATALAESLNAELFLDRLTLGPTFGHLIALNWGASKTGHLIVLEDDAQPVDGFLELAADWIDQHPGDLTSFYLGTGKPRSYQIRIEAALTQADSSGSDHIALSQLIHAVSYTIPCGSIHTLPLTTRQVADFGLGTAWFRTTHRSILYTVPSYVDHADTGSLTNPKNQLLRSAWRIHHSAESHVSPQT